MFVSAHSLSVGAAGELTVVCPYEGAPNELCRAQVVADRPGSSCMPYVPCGCSISGDFEEGLRHDGEDCPRKVGQHLYMRHSALYVPRPTRCALRDHDGATYLYDANQDIIGRAQIEGTVQITDFLLEDGTLRLLTTAASPALVSA